VVSVRYFSPILNLIRRDKLAHFLRSQCNKNAPPTTRVDRFPEASKHIPPILFFFMGAPEFRTSGCRHLGNRGSDLSVLTVTDTRAVRRSGGSGSPHLNPLTENGMILDVFGSPDLQMWVARLLGNFLNGTEKARVAYEELKCKSMLDNWAELHK